VAVAADMFGDRRQIADAAEATKVIGDLRSDPARLRARGLAALEALAGLSQVDETRLGAIGFCFGGSTVLELARAGADIRGVVSFHGALDTTTPAQRGAVKASILVCRGSDDPIVPSEQVGLFEREMRDAEADWQIITYGSTFHSFTNPAANGSISPAIRYNERSDRRSWRAMQSFFEERFSR
jgi:dienelactone hydrolase